MLFANSLCSSKGTSLRTDPGEKPLGGERFAQIGVLAVVFFLREKASNPDLFLMSHLWCTGDNKVNLIFLPWECFRPLLVRGCGLAKRKRCEGGVGGAAGSSRWTQPTPHWANHTKVTEDPVCLGLWPRLGLVVCHPEKGCYAVKVCIHGLGLM